jgi:hypothetical protein
MARTIFRNIWNLSTHTLLHLLVLLENCLNLSVFFETPSLHHLVLKWLLLLLQFELLRQHPLTLLLLVAELHHGLLLDDAWFNGCHNNVNRGHRCGLREPLLLGHRNELDALLVLMLPQQHGILLDGLVRDRIMRLLLVRVAQSASGVES